MLVQVQWIRAGRYEKKKKWIQDAPPVIDEAGHVSMLGSINHKRLFTGSRPRDIQMSIDIIKVAATILVIPESTHFNQLLIPLQ